MSFAFVYGCRPSTGVKANTTMVKDIYYSFIENGDRINFTVLLPNAFTYMSGNDVNFEIASSAKIKTIKLYYKHKVVMLSIGLVIAHKSIGDESWKNAVLCHKMLKHGLKVERVHTYYGLSLSHLEEKITWVVEMTTGNPLSFAQLQGQLALVVIVNLGEGFYLESEKVHKSDISWSYDYVNRNYPGRPQIFPKSKDSTYPFKNFQEVRYDDR
jgi:hypothetical protein